MRQSWLLFLLLILFNQQLVKGQSASRYQIHLSDKGSYTVSDVELSEKSLLRRENQGIELEFSDISIYKSYLDHLIKLGIDIKGQSKWMNCLFVKMNDSDSVKVASLPFVKKVVKGNLYASKTHTDDFTSVHSSILPYYNYGLAKAQISQLEGEILHNKGYQGQGMTIAVFDAGFNQVNEHSGFKKAFENQLITAGPDYVLGIEKIQYKHSNHGKSVLSTMLAFSKDRYVGTAPKANYILIRTENASSESLVEEYNWLQAAEYVDSLGVDMINSSLGYTVFDDTTENHTYEELNGDKTPITIAADLAARKGILVVNSAGNSGGSSWYYIGAPADGDSVFTIGSVNSEGMSSTFSSHGLTVDGRVKPNVVAHGEGIYAANGIDDYTPTNGTSFSSPVMCGMTACLWQYLKVENPSTTNMEVIQKIEESAHLYPNFNEDYGYGIPDFKSIVPNISVYLLNDNETGIYPNPFSNIIYLKFSFMKKGRVELVALSGQIVYEESIPDNTLNLTLETEYIPKGIYLLRIHSNSGTKIYKVVK